MNEHFITYEDLKKLNTILFFNNNYLVVTNNSLHTQKSLNLARVIYRNPLLFPIISYLFCKTIFNIFLYRDYYGIVLNNKSNHCRYRMLIRGRCTFF